MKIILSRYLGEIIKQDNYILHYLSLSYPHFRNGIIHIPVDESYFQVVEMQVDICISIVVPEFPRHSEINKLDPHFVPTCQRNLLNNFSPVLCIT